MELNVGAFLKEAIALNNMTQKEAAKKMNISPQSLSMYINNHRMPDIECLLLMVNILGVDLEMILKMRELFCLKSRDVPLFHAINKLSDKEKDILFFFIPLIHNKL